jgi:hypothetical protein
MALGAFLRMAGTKALPMLGKLGSAKAMPWVLRGAGAVGGAAPGIMRGDLGQAVVGGGLGAASTLGLGGLSSRLAPGAAQAAAGALGGAGLRATLAGNVGRLAVPVVGGLTAGRVLGAGFPGPQIASAAGGVGKAAMGVGGRGVSGGAGWVMHNTTTGETIPLGAQGVQDALAPGMGQYGPTDAMGTILNQIDPSGPYAGRRLGTKLDTKTNAEALNILMPTILKWSEETKRRDLARDMQAAGIRQNIATNAALNQIAAQASADRGTTASSQLGGAITNKYSFG